MTKFVALFLIISLLLSAKWKESSYFYIPKNWPKPTYDFSDNKLTKAKIELGRVLFYDPNLSQNNTISCASCHSPYNAFTHVDHDLSHGINDRIGTRNSPALMNLAWKKNYMWDGAILNLDLQSLAPISHQDEMGSSIEEVVKKLASSTTYRKAFYKAFNDSTITGEYTLKALSSFMLTLISANSKYDRVKRKKEKFSTQEENGYALFKHNCASCHQEPLFTNHAFMNNGLPIDPSLKDFGRQKISGKSEDSLKFKVPTLRNIEFSYPYMHDGRFGTVAQVINHYRTGVQNSATVDPLVQGGINMTNTEAIDLSVFLKTLSDSSILTNPRYKMQ